MFCQLAAKKLSTFKHILYNDELFSEAQFQIVCTFDKHIEDIQIFGMNMPFITSSEAKSAYYISGEATNEICIFSLHEMK